MKYKKHIMPFVSLIFAAIMSIGLLPGSSIASDYNNTASNRTKSKRIEVYNLSQKYWDIQYGDTLDGIVMQLLPNNPSKHAALKRDIVRLNPHVFIDANPSRMLVNKRLWLPVYMKHADTRVNPLTTTVESYSWGNIKRRKQ